jgi:hypothetical protein
MPSNLHQWVRLGAAGPCLTRLHVSVPLGLPERAMTRNSHCTNATAPATRSHPRSTCTAGGITIQKISRSNDHGIGPCHKTSEMATGPAHATKTDDQGPRDHPRRNISTAKVPGTTPAEIFRQPRSRGPAPPKKNRRAMSQRPFRDNFFITFS